LLERVAELGVSTDLRQRVRGQHGVYFVPCSPAARFVTGVVLPVDGGFTAFGGV
jgi:hypothetical protein